MLMNLFRTCMHIKLRSPTTKEILEGDLAVGDILFYIFSFIEKEGIFINGLILDKNWTMQEQVIPIIFYLENM